jgi:hypothetical protein
VERVCCLPAVRSRVCERADDVEQLDDGAGPAVSHDQRQRVFVLGADVDEVDVHPVDFGRELGQGVEPRLDASEVVVGHPVPCEFLQRRQLHALGSIFEELLGWPARRLDAAAQLSELLFWNVDVEGANLDAAFDGASHDDLRCWLGGSGRTMTRNGLILHETDAGAVRFMLVPRQPEPSPKQPLRSRLPFWSREFAHTTAAHDG